MTNYTYAICTTMRNMPTSKRTCPYMWNSLRQIHLNQSECDTCDLECVNHCGTSIACPCSMVKVVKPRPGQMFDLTKSGLYIQLRNVKYKKIGSTIRIGV